MSRPRDIAARRERLRLECAATRAQLGRDARELAAGAGLAVAGLSVARLATSGSRLVRWATFASVGAVLAAPLLRAFRAAAQPRR